jgi:hypothetical protein
MGPRGAGLPQAQILERAVQQPPAAPSKVEETARFLDGELRTLFRTGVSVCFGQPCACIVWCWRRMCRVVWQPCFAVSA